MGRGLVLWSCLVLMCTVAYAQKGRSVVLPAIEAQHAASYFTLSDKIDSGWIPAPSEVARLESNLGEISSLRAEGAVRGAQIAHPENSNRQYVGVLIHGHKYILVFAFPGEPAPNKIWEKQIYVIFDGGTSVWRVLYDAENGKFSHLVTNGVA